MRLCNDSLRDGLSFSREGDTARSRLAVPRGSLSSQAGVFKHGQGKKKGTVQQQKASETQSRHRMASVASSASAQQAGPESVVKELVYEVREAKQDDWWQVAEVHCRSFYPKATCLLGILLRFDRVETLKNASETGELDGPGRFACFGAWLSKSGACDLLSAEGIMRAQAYKRIPSFLQIFVARPLRANFRKTPEDCGLLGSVMVDSIGEFVPPRNLKGFSPERPGIAYIGNLAVDQKYRRRGIGRNLLARAIQAAQTWDCRAVLLQCDPKNEGARQMYRDAGFRHVAYEPPLLQVLEGRVGTRLELMLKKLSKPEPSEQN